ncbi:probable serine/threonine-protein kinase SIS8 isoform X2 [Primulina huaijiensis]|uniref:probable serine/threonine-protein kinase SIS8 isoform X2 n=1 Tax=Primulina huaijiensis TaxID=1492673 RepID=UPI003CC71139
MKSFLKKLHIGSNHSEKSEGSSSPSKVNNRLVDVSPAERLSDSKSENKSFSAISAWLNSVTHRRSSSPPSSSNVPRVEKRVETFDSVDSSSLDAALDAAKRESEFSNSRDPDVEEYQIQLALELSAREDPEAVQIEAVKQISLGSCHPENTPAEVAAFRYWNYNALSYDDKILDGFYDLHGILVESTSSRIPSLMDLQGTPVSDDIHWEAIVVNRAADTKLLSFEQQALDMAFKLKPDSVDFVTLDMVQNLATLVSDHLGGPVSNPDKILIAWRNHSYSLKVNHGSMVLPLGSLTIGLARHRALLFKILADSLDIPCCLVKGQEYTGSDEVAMNIVKIDGREYIVDLMADPGTLIPSDVLGAHIDHENTFHVTSSSGGITSSLADQPKFSAMHGTSNFGENDFTEQESMDRGDILSSDVKGKQMKAREGKHGADRSKKPFAVETGQEICSRTNYPFPHARSPSWTEGISSPAVRRMKVNDVSQLMVDAAKDNPMLAQKLHDVLRESGVVAPPNLFTEMYPEKFDFPPVDIEPVTQEKEKKVSGDKHRTKGYNILNPAFLPPLPHHGFRTRGTLDKPLEHQSNLKKVVGHHASSEYEVEPSKYRNNVPVAAAAAAAAAAVASSMVVAVAKANNDPKLQLPVTAAATVTAVVATTAAVSKQYDILEMAIHSPDSPVAIFKPVECIRSDGEAIATASEEGSCKQDHEGLRLTSEGERISDRSVGNESFKSDATLDDVADCEIPWEDITLGSYGEVYRGDWHGTEVAVKRFLDQDKIGESLEEFKSEVLIMKRLRHPNVVLFMGAVTRPPNLSIVTEFLPRGSLYRLIHRPNNQLDERRRLRMALDAARGLNYLHNCSPLIVHLDLKSPNLLVDKNWVVKVSDFGLSRMKHNTYLSSRSTAGTAEWMAPEILRNEPSNEKCDVYSFGVILWELFTLQQPWLGMNPMQVVGAVGFQHRRLEIPDNMDPFVANLIRKCWQTDPMLRPSFTEIMALLKPLQKPITSKQRT